MWPKRVPLCARVSECLRLYAAHERFRPSSPPLPHCARSRAAVAAHSTRCANRPSPLSARVVCRCGSRGFSSLGDDAKESAPPGTHRTARTSNVLDGLDEEPATVLRTPADPITSSSVTSMESEYLLDDDEDTSYLEHDGFVSPPTDTRPPTPRRFTRPAYSAANSSSLSPYSSSYSSPSPSSDPFNSSFNSFTPNSTFVSSHYRIDPQSVLKYIGERKNLVFSRVAADRITIRDCPFCRKPTHGKADNQFKLTVWLDTGSHNCLRCGSKGSWFDFKKKMGDIPNITNVMGDKMDANRVYAGTNKTTEDAGAPVGFQHDASGPARSHDGKTTPPLPIQSVVHEYPANLFTMPRFAPVLDYLLTSRGLTRETLSHYQIGACAHKFPNPDKNNAFEEHICITMPWIKTTAQLDEIRSQMEPAVSKTKALEKEKAKKRAAKEKEKMEKAAAAAAAASAYNEHGQIDLGAPKDIATLSEALSTPASTAPPPVPSFPTPSSDAQVTERVKLRSLTHKGNQRLLPSGGVWNFFGWHTVPLDAEELVITEGEFDAMAVWQGTGLPAVSLPNGARSLPVELLPLLEKFKRIYLWLDDDAPGKEGAEKFARKLGVGRCLIVKSSLEQRRVDGSEEYEEDLSDSQQPPPKDANDALRQGADLRALIRAARPLKHEQILRFSDLRNDVLREFTDPLARRGVQSRYLPGLNRLLKGHRAGELTIITGATGVGKTTVLSQLSLDYCSQGVNTLWGSFEIRNTKLARTMISQYANMNFSTEVPNNSPPIDPEGNMAPGADDTNSSEPLVPQPQTSPPPDPNMLRQFNVWADRFEQLPLYFMKFFGSNSVETVLDAMEYAVYVYDVEHILLDNLQFMLSEQGRGGYDRFETQDRAIALFRQFASVKNVHITLVIHPRKEHDSHALGVSSIFGGAKATQEADNILIIQKPVSVDENTLSGGGGGAIASELARLKAELDAVRIGGEDASWLGQHRRIEVKKNRFDGELGSIPFKYDKRTCRIYELQPGGGKKSNGSTGGGGQPVERPPPPPRQPRPTRATVFGGNQTSNDAAIATENANRAALASMQPKAKSPPRPVAQPADQEEVAPAKKRTPTKKRAAATVAELDLVPESSVAMAEVAAAPKKRASKKKTADPAAAAAAAPSLDSPPIEVVAD